MKLEFCIKLDFFLNIENPRLYKHTSANVSNWAEAWTTGS